jgi:4a-hydroxytetrahydrobiopterin dehydratase
MELLSESEIDDRMPALSSAWRREGDAIVAELECDDFATAVELVNKIAEVAERADHHPDILIHRYRRLQITLTTHSAGGLTRRDFEVARAIDAL